MEQTNKVNICPICQQANDCKIEDAANCWCMEVSIPRTLIERLPEHLQGTRCLCKKCATFTIEEEQA